MKKILVSFCLILIILSHISVTAYSETAFEVSGDTNSIPNWPKGPSLNAGSAFLFEANTGVVLYAKNVHERMYPASTTKLMTALLAAENSDMNDIVKFSYDAVFSLEPGSSNIGIDPGQSMPMKECLYGIMVGSANEVANAVAEHVGGSMDAFVQMMNDRVAELGLKDTHFVNANGLHDENHYTSAYDLGMIAKEFFNTEALFQIGNTPNHHFEPTATQPDDFYIRNKHKLITGEIPYEGIKGGKTGYTTASNETLVTCCEQKGMKLICVIMNEDSPEQFYDTVKLFDYGFSNFSVANISANEEKYSIKSTNLFPTNVDILGNSKQFLRLNEKNTIIQPANVLFKDLESTVSYDTNSDSEVAHITYSYHGAYLGYGVVEIIDSTPSVSVFDSSLTTQNESGEIEKEQPVFINVIHIAVLVLSIAFIIILITLIHSIFTNYNIFDNIRHKKKRRRKRW